MCLRKTEKSASAKRSTEQKRLVTSAEDFITLFLYNNAIKM